MDVSCRGTTARTIAASSTTSTQRPPSLRYDCFTNAHLFDEASNFKEVEQLLQVEIRAATLKGNSKPKIRDEGMVHAIPPSLKSFPETSRCSGARTPSLNLADLLPARCRAGSHHSQKDS